MAAIFLSYPGNDLFQTIQSDGSALISVSSLDDLTSNSGLLAMITDMNAQTADITQFFPTFDNIIHYQYFGKGIGSITINGLLFSSCSGDIPGLSAFYAAVKQMRGQQTTISLGPVSFIAVVTGSSCSLMSEPDTMAQFQISMQIISDNV